MKIAIIDIGSNSVRLMLWADGKTLYKKLITTRLGAGIASEPVLREDAMARTVAAVCAFCREAEEMNASIYAFATAAVRSAKNGADFCERVFRACGVKIEVVSGEDEAQLGLAGALGSGDGGIIDIGGASTEVCYRKNGETVFSVSLPIGAVKLFDLCSDNADKLRTVIAEAVAPLKGVKPVGVTYAIGGTASTIAALYAGMAEYDGTALHGLRLTREYLGDTSKKLLALTAEERKRIPEIAPRADIIAGGTLLLYEITKVLNLSEVRFSDHDNLEGYMALRGLQ